MVMKAFAPYFKAEEEGAKAAQLKEIYDSIRMQIPNLPNATTVAARSTTLKEYEEARPELCEPIEAAHQFFGFTKGVNLLSKYLQWVYVPAVKDASTEQEESNKSALGQLFERTIRTKVNFKQSLSALKASLEAQYREIIDAEQGVLDDLQKSMQTRLREWATPGATLQLAWHFDPNKTVVVHEPVARAAIGEDRFIGEIARLGHGMQRSFLIALLHELASNNAEGGPTLILGFEEPELYQHPPQAQHMCSVLESLATMKEGNAQIIISTHSPYFVSARGFENVRVVRKHHLDKCSLVASTTYARVEQIIANALEAKPDLPSVTMTSIEQIMQPSQRELYFTRFAVLVEGIEDIAFISTHLHVIGRWAEFRKLGCHFVIAVGKTNLSRPIAIARELCIRHFVVLDGDGNKKNKDEQIRDNSCVLRLCGMEEFNPLPAETLWHENVVMWPTCIFDAVQADVGAAAWSAAEDQARQDNGYVRGVKQKNNMLIAAVIQELSQGGKHSSVLTKVCDHILQRAADPTF